MTDIRTSRKNKTILFARRQSQIQGRLEKVLKTLLPNETIELYRNIESLKKRVSLPSAEEGAMIVVIVVEDKEDLVDIISIEYLLYDARIVLVLPNRRRDIISLAHSLRPRFLTYKDSDFKELASVVAKMLDDSKILKSKKHREVSST